MARILILVENLSVPFDRRVWQESRALVEAGHEVTVICPRGAKRDTEPYASIEGVEIHRYALEAATGGPAGYRTLAFTAIPAKGDLHGAGLMDEAVGDGLADLVPELLPHPSPAAGALHIPVRQPAPPWRELLRPKLQPDRRPA